MITPRWRTLNLTTAILPDEAQRLRELAKDRTVLEIGAANGYSAIIMALAGAKHVTSVDPHGETWIGDTFKSMTDNLEAFGVTNKVTIVRETSIVAMSRFRDNHQLFGFIFLDGSAITEENKDDIILGLQLLEPGGTIARHDYGHEDYPQFKTLLDESFPNGPTRLTNTLFEVTP